ncbi:MAG: hypothetical protein IJX58_00600 [Clostridia bacterium]|nr:hypothetical protein [Clostridia bacterium]
MSRIYGLIALGVLVVLLIIFGIGTSVVVAQISDSTDNTDPVIVENGVSLTDVVHHIIVSALDGANGGRLSLKLDSYDMNELLYALSMEEDFSKIGIRSIYIEEADGEHRLCVPIELMGVNSLASGELKMYQEGDTIFAEVDGLSVGNLGIDSWIVSLFGVKDKIVKLLDEKGITSYFVGDLFRLQMSRAELGSLLSTALAENENVGLVNALYSLLMLRGDAVSIEIASPTDISVGVDMTDFNGLSTPRFDGVNDYTESLLAEGVIDRGVISTVAKYYLNGYEKLTDEEKTTVSERLVAKSTPEEITSYAGIVEREKISLLSILLTQLELNTDFLLPGFKIGDGDISAMLSELPLVGTVWQYASYRDNSCAYIAVQSLYCVIGDDLIEIYIDLNLNGYLLTVRADFISRESPLVSIGGSLGKAYLGDVELGEYEVDQLFGFLCGMLQYDWIYTDPVTKSLTLDFTATFEDSNLLVAILKNSRNIVTVCKSRLVTKGGYVQITFTLFH